MEYDNQVGVYLQTWLEICLNFGREVLGKLFESRRDVSNCWCFELLIL